MKSDREKSLLKNTFIITIGKICTQLITFFLLPLYTSILTTAEFGLVDLLNTLVMLLIPIVTFQVEQAVFRFLIDCRDNEERKNTIISSSIYSVILQCILFTFLYLICSFFINNEYKIYLLLNVIAYIFSSLLLQIARGIGDNKLYSLGSFISASFTIIFNVLLLVIFKLGAIGMLLGTFIGQAVLILFILWKLNIINILLKNKLNKKIVLELWKYSFPLIPNALSWWIFNASDRVIVSAILGVSLNGILAAASKFSTVYITIYNIFSMSWTESVSVNINDDDIENYFNNIFDFVIRIFVSLALGIVAFMPFVYSLLINENYAFGYKIVPILVYASFFNVIVGMESSLYIAKKKTKQVASTSIVSAILNIIIHLALINYIGLYAAAISTFSSFFIMSIYRFFDLRKNVLKIKFNKFVMLSSIFVISIVTFIYYCNSIILQMIGILLSVIFAIVLNKKLLLTIYLKFKEGEKNVKRFVKEK